MGCTGSQISDPSSLNDKIVVWLLGGGPGSPKQIATQVMVDQYKFRFLSAMQLMRFQQTSGSPQSLQIKRLTTQKKEIPSALVVKVIKKIFSLYGPRKYLLQGFPRNQADIIQLEKLTSKYKQVEIHKYIQLDIGEAQMKQSGMKAFKEMKPESSTEDVQKQVRIIIEGYRETSKNVLEHYGAGNKLIRIDFAHNDFNKLSGQIRNILSDSKISPVERIPLIILDGSDIKETQALGIKLARKLGIKYWAVSQFQKKNAQQIATILVGKFQQYNYKGAYMISGFPKTKEDLNELMSKVAAFVKISAYAACLRAPATSNQQQGFEELKKTLTQYQIPSVLVDSGPEAFTKIYEHFDSQLSIRGGGIPAKVILAPTLQSLGSDHFAKIKQSAQVLDFDEAVKQQIAREVFRSDVLVSSQTLGRSVPAHIACSIIMQRIIKVPNKKIIVRGFPQSDQQYRLFLERGRSLQVLGGLFFQIPANSKSDQATRGQHQKIGQLLTDSCDKFKSISEKTTYQQLKSFVDDL